MRSGDIFLQDGDLDSWRVIKRGTFNTERLYKQLRTKLHLNAPAEKRLSQKFGLVVIMYEVADPRERISFMTTNLSNTYSNERGNRSLIKLEVQKSFGDHGAETWIVSSNGVRQD